MNVSDIMKNPIITISPTDTISYAAKIMSQYNIGYILVVDGHNLIGIITDRDIVIRCIPSEIDYKICTVDKIMTNSAIILHPSDSIKKAVSIMIESNIRRVPVVEDRKLKGLITIFDILKISEISNKIEISHALTEFFFY